MQICHTGWKCAVVPSTVIIRAITETYDFRFRGRSRGIVEVPKSETQVSPDLRGAADGIDDLAHALADYFRRKVAVVGTDGQRN